MRSILLNPGPVTLSERVRQAAVRHDWCHREAEYFQLQDRVRQGLLDVYSLAPADWQAVLLTGSGTTALEAMLASLLHPDARLLVLENGVYGERLSRLAELHQVEHQSLDFGWKSGWDLSQVEQTLDSGAFTHVAAVHHETTTGRLNDIHSLAKLCEGSQAGMLVDSVSSFGAESLPFHSPALLACAATANKCLHGIPGSCFVVLRSELLKNCVSPPRSLTLDLALWGNHQSRQSTPFTPAVNSLLALDAALAELAQQGGRAARHARYLRLAGQVARCLHDLGVEPLLPADQSSCVLRSYHLPSTGDYASLHDALKQRGFVIYAGQGALQEELFRISTMGDISDYDMGRLLTALREILA